MTHRERLEELLTDMGVVFREADAWEGNGIIIEADTGPKNGGYTGFFAVFSFDQEGTLDAMGVWE